MEDVTTGQAAAPTGESQQSQGTVAAPAEAAKPLSFGDLDDMFKGPAGKEPLPFKNDDSEDREDAKTQKLQEDEQDDSEGELEGSEDLEESDEEDSEDGEGEEEGDSVFDKSNLSAEDLAKKYKVKVDGKERAFSLEQLLSNAASGFHTKERYEAFEKEKKDFGATKQETEQTIAKQQAKLAYFDSQVTPIIEALKKKDVFAAISALSPHANLDSLEVERSVLRNALPQIAKRLGLSGEEVKERLRLNAELNRTLDLEQEAKFYRSKAEKEAQAREESNKPNPEIEAQSKIREFAIQVGVTLPELNKAAEMAAELKGDPNTVTFDDIEAVITKTRVVNRALDAIETRRPNLVQHSEFVDKVIKGLIDNPSWTARQLGGFIEEEARKIAEAKKGSLERTISNKATKSGIKPRFENSSQERKPLKFSDLQNEDGLM